jgi:hypothetical protein
MGGRARLNKASGFGLEEDGDHPPLRGWAYKLGEAG